MVSRLTGVIVWYINYRKGNCVKVFDNFDQLREWHNKYSVYNQIKDVKAMIEDVEDIESNIGG